MQNLPCSITVKQQSFFIVIVRVLLLKTMHIRDVTKTLTLRLSSIQELSMWGKKMIFSPDLAINKGSSHSLPKSCTVINASGDADVDIVVAAVKASDNQPTTLIGEDTDLLIFLLYYAGTNNRGLCFRTDKSKATKVYGISKMKQVLGSELCSQLLFIHAFTGCDTTPRIFSVDKQKAFQKLVNGESTIRSCANVFCSRIKQIML